MAGTGATRPRDFSGQFKRYIANGARVSVTAELQDMAADLASGMSKALADALERLAEPPDRAEQRAMYTRLGEGTVNAVLAEYDNEIGSNGHAQYRAGSGRLSGRLRPVLAGNVDGAIYRVVNGPTRSGGVRIELFNQRPLDARAAHWARLNFGAAPAETQTSPTFRIQFRNRAIPLTFGASPSKGFMIPAGFWVEGGEHVPPGMPVAGSAFYRRLPSGVERRYRPSKAKLTAGIVGHWFLDAGLAYFAREAPDEFNAMIDRVSKSRMRVAFRYDVGR